MSETHDGLEVLVASGDGPFGGAVVETVDGTEGVASARHVEPTTDSLDRVTGEAVDAAVVDGQTEEPAAVVERLTDEWNLPVVVLAEAPEVVARAVEAGAADVFPRVQAETQCELVVDCRHRRCWTTIRRYPKISTRCDRRRSGVSGPRVR